MECEGRERTIPFILELKDIDFLKCKKLIKTQMINQVKIQPLNLTGKVFCENLGLSFNGQIMQSLRELGLVSFFKVGKKYLYAYEDIEAVNQKLRNGKISIKVNNGYYITLN